MQRLCSSSRTPSSCSRSSDISFSHLSLSQLDWKVLYVQGKNNQVADALSRFDIARAVSATPRLRVSTFEPPRITLGPST